jgi:hypothetical protein
VTEAAGEFAADFEFQLIAGIFHEEIGDLAAATKYRPRVFIILFR